jgi:hypothetical protein
MWFLQRFKKDEIQVIKENSEFISVQNYLKDELKNLEKGDSEFITIEQLEKDLEQTIRKHEA